MVVVDRLIDVRKRLRFHTLGGINHQQGAFHRSKRARNFIGKVHVTWGINQVQRVLFTVICLVDQANGLSLNGNAALLLDIHGIENLLRHLTISESAGRLDEAIGQGGLTVVDVRDNREIANIGQSFGRHGRSITTALLYGKAHNKRPRAFLPFSSQ